MKIPAKKITIVVTLICVAFIGFLVYSGAVTFSNYPWTKSQSFNDGAYLGFTINGGKQHAFNNAIKLQREGVIRALNLLDAIPTTYSNKYKGNPIREEDYQRVSISDSWHLGLSECNCWLVLDFSNGMLIKIVRNEYHGPTE